MHCTTGYCALQDTVLCIAVHGIAHCKTWYCVLQYAVLRTALLGIAHCTTLYCALQDAVLHTALGGIAHCTTWYCALQDAVLHTALGGIAHCNTQYCTAEGGPRAASARARGKPASRMLSFTRPAPRHQVRRLITRAAFRVSQVKIRSPASGMLTGKRFPANKTEVTPFESRSSHVRGTFESRSSHVRVTFESRVQVLLGWAELRSPVVPSRRSKSAVPSPSGSAPFHKRAGHPSHPADSGRLTRMVHVGCPQSMTPAVPPLVSLRTSWSVFTRVNISFFVRFNTCSFSEYIFAVCPIQYSRFVRVDICARCAPRTFECRRTGTWRGADVERLGLGDDACAGPAQGRAEPGRATGAAGRGAVRVAADGGREGGQGPGPPHPRRGPLPPHAPFGHARAWPLALPARTEPLTHEHATPLAYPRAGSVPARRPLSLLSCAVRTCGAFHASANGSVAAEAGWGGGGARVRVPDRAGRAGRAGPAVRA